MRNILYWRCSSSHHHKIGRKFKNWLAVNHIVFKDVSTILFLNKMDLLEDKVVRKKVDISKYFEEEFSDIDQVRKHVQKFNGDPLNLQDVKNFILYLFVTKQKFIHSQRPIYHHFTTAVNTKNIQYVFTSVKETILRKNLSALMLQWRKCIFLLMLNNFNSVILLDDYDYYSS